MEHLTTQYTSYNQRRLHYSTLFWACLALHFSGILVALLFSNHQTTFTKPILFGLIGLASFLMSFIAFRLHHLEAHYETLLRKIEDHWINQNIDGVQRADVTGKYSSRKLVILALFIVALVFSGLSAVKF